MKDGVAAIKVKRLDTLKDALDRNSSDDDSEETEEVKEQPDRAAGPKSKDGIAFERRLS